MIGLRAITRAVGPSLARCELTFVEREPIDVVKAGEQHDAYRAVLASAGADVEVIPADASLPDAVFVEDTAVVLDEIAVVCRPGSAMRRREIELVAELLSRDRKISRIEAPGTLDGGDVLAVGRERLVGLSTRSNREGIEQFAAIVGALGYRVMPITIHGCLHLKTAVTALDDETLLINPQWIDRAELQRWRTIEVDPKEPFAANALIIGGVVHLTDRSPRTRRLLEDKGYRTKVIDISELEKAEAGLTCLSLLVQQPESSDTSSAERELTSPS